MTMTKQTERLPRTTEELEHLAEYYSSHDTSADMEHGEWVEPQPMATTSLRLPTEVISQLKQQARVRHLRYTSYVRSILERVAVVGPQPELADITERLERIERALRRGQPHDDQKTA
jgi:predicted DNA binding CopG/RHH family protein